MLNTDELMVLLVNELITPRTFRVKPTQVAYVSGLGRIDYVQVTTVIYMLYPENNKKLYINCSVTVRKFRKMGRILHLRFEDHRATPFVSCRAFLVSTPCDLDVLTFNLIRELYCYGPASRHCWTLRCFSIWS